MVGLGVSIFLTAVGAVLAWAVQDNLNGVDLHMVGVILMIVGVVGFLLSLLFLDTWGGLRGRRRITRYDDDLL